MNERCSHCRRSFDHAPLCPVLHDDVWRKLARKNESLCGECMFVTAVKLGVRLSLSDLKPCLFNLFHRPHSWFDLFSNGEPPEVVRAWLDEAERLEDETVPEGSRAAFQEARKGGEPFKQWLDEKEAERVKPK